MGTISDALKKGFDTAAVKTSEAVDISKKYLDVAKVEKQIDMMYQRLGRATYNTAQGIKDEKDISETLIGKIAVAEAELERVKKIYEQSKAIKCTSCGKKNPSGSQFCLKCGESLKK